jgi:hypothetical protein
MGKYSLKKGDRIFAVSCKETAEDDYETGKKVKLSLYLTN